MSSAPDFDLIIMGGGLSGSLLAWRLRQKRPDVRVGLLERGERLGGNHTWSFFASDLTTGQNAWVEPLVCHRWPAYQVWFPKRRRELSSGYRSITSERLAEVVAQALGDSLVTKAEVAQADAHRVQLADGRTFDAACVIDARGERASPHLVLGYQKFLGQEVRLERPHGQTMPIIMDATVAQDDGYRFVYTLPFSDDTVLIEDTYYSDGEELAPGA